MDSETPAPATSPATEPAIGPVTEPPSAPVTEPPSAPVTEPATETIVVDPLGGTVRRTVLPNGLRVVSEAIPAMRSVSFGIWVGIGSRDEDPVDSGVSHFLEHL